MIWRKFMNYIAKRFERKIIAYSHSIVEGGLELMS